MIRTYIFYLLELPQLTRNALSYSIAVMDALPLLPRGEVVSVGSKGEGTFDIDVATFERAYRADPDILTYVACYSYLLERSAQMAAASIV